MKARQYKGLTIPDELTKETRKGATFDGKHSCGIAVMCKSQKMHCMGENYLSCCDCICSIDHKKELEELIEMWDKEFEEFEGLKIPNGIERVQHCDYNEACALGCTSCADYEKAGCVSNGITKINCPECLCSEGNKEFLEKYLQQKDNNPIKPGMVVKHDISQWCLVLRVHSDFIEGWSLGSATNSRGFHFCELGGAVRVPISSIENIYKSTRSFEMIEGSEIWRILDGFDKTYLTYVEELDPPVLELTVSDIEKKYGRKVKIVKEK